MFSRLLKVSMGLVGMGAAKTQCVTNFNQQFNIQEVFRRNDAQQFLLKIDKNKIPFSYFPYASYPPKNFYQCQVLLSLIFKREGIKLEAFRLSYEGCEIVVQLQDESYYVIYLDSNKKTVKTLSNYLIYEQIIINSIERIEFNELIRIKCEDKTYTTE